MKLFIIIPIFTAILFATELKIATYNVDNLFNDVNEGTEYSDYKLNTHNWNSVTFNKKLNNISKVICELNADIVALQEIENRNTLKILLKKLQQKGCRYPYSAITNKIGSAIQVALISKKPIKKQRDIIVSNSRADRNILEVTLKTKPKLTIFVNHWRSKRAAESQRLKSAKALMRRISSMPKGSEYIILGDFNSEYNECVNIEPKFNDTNRVCGIDTTLKTFYKGRLLRLRDKIDSDTIYHYNLWGDISARKRWSHSFYGKKRAIDSIIIPKSLNDNKGWFYKKGSFNVFKKGYLFKNRGYINRWEYKKGKHTGKGYSDHLPIYAIFTTSNKKALKHESSLDKFWKLFISKKEKKSKNIENIEVLKEAKEIDINKLYSIDLLKEPVILKNVCVIFKRGDIGVIKTVKNSLPITLYKSAEGLKEGICYDLKIYKKKNYYKLSEITDLDILKKVKEIDIKNFISKFDTSKFSKYPIGEIVKDIRGIYNNRYININGINVRLYLKKKRKGLLRKNSKLYIKKAQIGYYKGERELIVYSLKDITKE